MLSGANSPPRRQGSPPRAWGQYFPDCQVVAETRFTPTGVGTIEISTEILTESPVHPHGRGDNERYMPGAFVGVGSPPRAWGQCCNDAARLQFHAVHPHGRGDNVENEYVHRPIDGSPPRAWGQCGVICVYTSPAGSPPRAWGQSRGTNRAGVRVRFTPTGVGTILTRRHGVYARAVHPHGRGDNARSKVQCLILYGSPPRAWGQ